MRKINYIAVHCTATAQTTSVRSIERYWKRELGWKYPGYHYIIKPSGERVQLLDEKKVSNGVRGHNHETINIAYIGGVDADNKPMDNRTCKQKASMLALLESLKERYTDAVIQGHRDFEGVKKACPSFDAKTEYENI